MYNPGQTKLVLMDETNPAHLFRGVRAEGFYNKINPQGFYIGDLEVRESISVSLNPSNVCYCDKI